MSFYQLSMRWAAKSLGPGRILHFLLASRLFGAEQTAETYQPSDLKFKCVWF